MDDTDAAAAPDGAAAGLEALAAGVAAGRYRIETALPTLGLVPAGQAVAMLGVNQQSLLDLARCGALTLLTLAGQDYVHMPDVQLLALRTVVEQTHARADSAVLLDTALRLYLAARPLATTWAIARTQQRPLVCGRRGAVHARFDLTQHSVVLAIDWVGRWAVDEGAVEHPELTRLPTGAELHRVALNLPGVAEQFNATALLPDVEGESPRQRRLNRWVRLDQDRWPMVVPPEVTALVERR